MRMQHHRHAALRRVVQMNTAVEVADHGDQRKMLRYRARRSVRCDKHGVWRRRCSHVLLSGSSANDHHPRCCMAAGGHIAQDRITGLSRP